MIYNHLNKKDFDIYKKKLVGLENKIERVCIENGFHIDRDRYYEESLNININISETEFNGNIGLQYIDKKGNIKFKFGLIKTYDFENIRHYLKVNIIQEDAFNFIEENIDTLLKLAIDIY